MPRPARRPGSPPPRWRRTSSRSSSRSSSRASSAPTATARWPRCSTSRVILFVAGVGAAGRRRAPGDARPARPRRRAGGARSTAGRRHILIALAAIAVVSVLAREPLADAHQRRRGVGRRRRARHRRGVAAAVRAARAAAVGPRLPRGRAQRRSSRARPPGRWRSRWSPPARRHRRLPRHAGLDRRHRGRPRAGCCARRLGPPDRATPPHPLAQARPQRRDPDRRARARRRAPERRRDHGPHALDDDASPASTPPRRWRPRPIVWVSVGIGLWVLPEATRRAAAGARPARRAAARARGHRRARRSRALAIFAAVPDAAAADRVRRRLRVGRRGAAAARRRVRAARRHLRHRPVPARPAPPRLRRSLLAAMALAEPLLLPAPATWRRSPAPCC